ncbi:hypothetical protein M5K25_007213 [Dendrobium thyrsiflorum]|uniref:DUF4283 domain-containing protein n=1 Tax=Dendrobium thyrsiflorum TaxID=117978 RepID=A0ABD0VEN7_DENTH
MNANKVEAGLQKLSPSLSSEIIRCGHRTVLPSGLRCTEPYRVPRYRAVSSTDFCSVQRNPDAPVAHPHPFFPLLPLPIAHILSKEENPSPRGPFPCMADPNNDNGFAFDLQEQVDIVRSTFFDVNPEIDDTMDDVDRIFFYFDVCHRGAPNLRTLASYWTSTNFFPSDYLFIGYINSIKHVIIKQFINKGRLGKVKDLEEKLTLSGFGNDLPLDGRKLFIDSGGEREGNPFDVFFNGTVDLQVDVEERRLEDINLSLIVEEIVEAAGAEQARQPRTSLEKSITRDERKFVSIVETEGVRETSETDGFFSIVETEGFLCETEGFFSHTKSFPAVFVNLVRVFLRYSKSYYHTNMTYIIYKCKSSSVLHKDLKCPVSHSKFTITINHSAISKEISIKTFLWHFFEKRMSIINHADNEESLNEYIDCNHIKKIG